MPSGARYVGTVPRLYPGETAVLFGTGPGLTKAVVDTIRPYHRAGKLRAMGVNDAYRIVPYLDVLYACDPQWWDLHAKEGWVRDYWVHSAWTQDRGTANRYGLSWVAGASGDGLYDKSPDRIHYGNSSGYQLLNVAVHMEVSRIILCGYNYSVGHFFGNHKGLANTNLGSLAHLFATVQQRHRQKVVNCTPGSHIKAFEKRELEDVLRELE